MLRESHRPGIEPTTCKSQVQRPTAEPPRNIDYLKGCLGTDIWLNQYRSANCVNVLHSIYVLLESGVKPNVWPARHAQTRLCISYLLMLLPPSK